MTSAFYYTLQYCFTFWRLPSPNAQNRYLLTVKKSYSCEVNTLLPSPFREITGSPPELLKTRWYGGEAQLPQPGALRTLPQPRREGRPAPAGGAHQAGSCAPPCTKGEREKRGVGQNRRRSCGPSPRSAGRRQHRLPPRMPGPSSSQMLPAGCFAPARGAGGRRHC